jgi:aminocarboxymuconate-semialdehyde decarboxylase
MSRKTPRPVTSVAPNACGCDVSRRRFLELGGMAATMSAFRMRASAQTPVSPALDTHAHYFPMEYLKSIAEQAGPQGFAVNLAAPAGPTLTGGGAVTVLDPSYWDLDKRLAAMDAAGIQLHALSLTMPMPHLAAGERGAELARIYNDAVVQAHAAHPDRFVGCAALPLNDITRSIAELERIGGMTGIRAVYSPTNISGKELSDPSLFPLYEQIQALNLPLMLHPHPAVVGLDRMQKFYLPNLLGNPFDTTLAVAHLVFGGVMDRFPRLNVLLPHAGGAFPYLYGRIQKGQAAIPDLRNVAERPASDYLKRFYYDTITHSPAALKYLVDLVGADRVVLGSDYCFNMGYERPRDIVGQLAISPADRDRILFANARHLLRVS